MRKKMMLVILSLLLVFVLFGCTRNEEKISSTVSSLSSNDFSSSVSDVSVKEDNNSDVSSDKKESILNSEENATHNQSKESETVTTTSNKAEALDSNVSTSSYEEINENIVTIIFKDYDGSVLKEEKLKKGEDGTAPEKPVRDGFVFIKWDTSYENVMTDIIVTAIYEEINEPTFVVDEVNGKPGDKVIVKVSVKNNPGILGILLNITYDESVMKLKKVKNGDAMSAYMFTPPKNMKSGCNVAWNINDIPDGELDGDVLILYFDVLKNTSKGSYPISVSCINNAFDNDYNYVPFDVVSGALNIE